MLNFQILFGQLKKTSEVCSIKTIEKMKFIICHMCRMMWNFPQRTYIA